MTDIWKHRWNKDTTPHKLVYVCVYIYIQLHSYITFLHTFNSYFKNRLSFLLTMQGSDITAHSQNVGQRLADLSSDANKMLH